MLTLFHRELTVVINAYFLAGIPIAVVALAGWMTPLYRQPWERLARWWSWGALGFVASAFVIVVPLG